LLSWCAMTTPTISDPSPATAAERFQFRIRDLLLVMLLIALALGAFVQQSGLLLLIFMGTALLGMVFVWKFSPAQIIVAIPTLGILLALFGPLFDKSRVGHGSQCHNNLKQISLALQLYHDVYGSFPPAFIADKSGRPMHSWRMLLLPFIEQENLYKLYRFDEPWDGPNNRQLADQIMQVYSCPDKHWKRTSETSYVAIIGPHTAWPGEKAAKLGDFQDGPANVLLVVEVHDSGIHWMEPRDLHVSQMSPTINAPLGQGISSDHPDYVNGAFADGMTRRLRETLPADVLRSWINVDDGTLSPPPR